MRRPERAHLWGGGGHVTPVQILVTAVAAVQLLGDGVDGGGGDEDRRRRLRREEFLVLEALLLLLVLEPII